MLGLIREKIFVDPISNSFKQNRNGRELYESKKIRLVIFPAHPELDVAIEIHAKKRSTNQRLW